MGRGKEGEERKGRGEEEGELAIPILVCFQRGAADATAPSCRRLRARTHQLQFRRNGENRKTNFSWSLKIGQVADCGDKMFMM